MDEFHSINLRIQTIYRLEYNKPTTKFKVTRPTPTKFIILNKNIDFHIILLSIFVFIIRSYTIIDEK